MKSLQAGIYQCCVVIDNNLVCDMVNITTTPGASSDAQFFQLLWYFLGFISSMLILSLLGIACAAVHMIVKKKRKPDKQSQ